MSPNNNASTPHSTHKTYSFTYHAPTTSKLHRNILQTRPTQHPHFVETLYQIKHHLKDLTKTFVKFGKIKEKMIFPNFRFFRFLGSFFKKYRFFGLYSSKFRIHYERASKLQIGVRLLFEVPFSRYWGQIPFFGLGPIVLKLEPPECEGRNLTLGPNITLMLANMIQFNTLCVYYGVRRARSLP